MEPCEPGRKFCPKCRTEKPLDQFHVRRAAKDGRQRYCKACQCAAVARSCALHGRPAPKPYRPDPWAIYTYPPLAALFAEFDRAL